MSISALLFSNVGKEPLTETGKEIRQNVLIELLAKMSAASINDCICGATHKDNKVCVIQPQRHNGTRIAGSRVYCRRCETSGPTSKTEAQAISNWNLLTARFQKFPKSEPPKKSIECLSCGWGGQVISTLVGQEFGYASKGACPNCKSTKLERL